MALVRPEPTRNICKEPPLRGEPPQAAAAQDGGLASHGVPSEQHHGVCRRAPLKFPTAEKDYCACGPHPFKIYRNGGSNYRSLFTSKIIRQRGWRCNERFEMEKLQYSASSHKEDHAKI